MRIALAALALPLLVLPACQVSKDEQNDTVTATYNEDVAENAMSDVGNFAENVASDVGNDIEKTANKVEDKADEVQTDSSDENKAN
jgi:hypothetical protein